MTVQVAPLVGHAGAVRALAGLLVALGDAGPSARALDAARTKALHAIGVTLAGRELAAVKVAASASASNAGPCTAIGLGAGLSGDAAAFFNGVAGHASLLEDCGPGGLREGSHPGTYVFPAALAAAQMANVDAARFLRGLIVGYEAVSRLGQAAPASIVARRFRPLGVSGPFGAAAAAAYIMGADAAGMAAALAISVNSAGGSTQGIFEGSMEAYFQAGASARNGLFAAQLALAGAVTAEHALEGEYGFFRTYAGEDGDLAALLADRDEAAICFVGIKRFASCLQNQQTVALIVDGLDAPLSASDIERVIIRRPAVGTHGLNSPGVSRSGAQPNRLAAQMSARFTASAALLGHPVHDPRFYQDHYADAELLALTDRVELVPLDSEAIEVDVTFTNGAAPVSLKGISAELLHPTFDTVRDRMLQRFPPAQTSALGDIAGIIETMDAATPITVLAQALARLS